MLSARKGQLADRQTSKKERQFRACDIAQLLYFDSLPAVLKAVEWLLPGSRSDQSRLSKAQLDPLSLSFTRCWTFKSPPCPNSIHYCFFALFFSSILHVYGKEANEDSRLLQVVTLSRSEAQADKLNGFVIWTRQRREGERRRRRRKEGRKERWEEKTDRQTLPEVTTAKSLNVANSLPLSFFLFSLSPPSPLSVFINTKAMDSIFEANTVGLSQSERAQSQTDSNQALSVSFIFCGWLAECACE